MQNKRKKKRVSKREIWGSFNADTQEFLAVWPKGAIVAVENITKQLYWRR